MLTPFSGMPVSIRTMLSVVFGAAVAGIGLFMRASEASALKQSGSAAPAPVEPVAEAAPSEMSVI